MRAGASSLQLSSSATSTTADIQLAAADRIDLFASSLALSTSSASAGDIKIDSAGTFTLSTSRNNTNILFLPALAILASGQPRRGISWTLPAISGPLPARSWRRHPVMWESGPPLQSASWIFWDSALRETRS